MARSDDSQRAYVVNAEELFFEGGALEQEHDQTLEE